MSLTRISSSESLRVKPVESNKNIKIKKDLEELQAIFNRYKEIIDFILEKFEDLNSSINEFHESELDVGGNYTEKKLKDFYKEIVGLLEDYFEISNYVSGDSYELKNADENVLLKLSGYQENEEPIEFNFIEDEFDFYEDHGKTIKKLLELSFDFQDKLDELIVDSQVLDTVHSQINAELDRINSLNLIEDFNKESLQKLLEKLEQLSCFPEIDTLKEKYLQPIKSIYLYYLDVNCLALNLDLTFRNFIDSEESIEIQTEIINYIKLSKKHYLNIESYTDSFVKKEHFKFQKLFNQLHNSVMHFNYQNTYLGLYMSNRSDNLHEIKLLKNELDVLSLQGEDDTKLEIPGMVDIHVTGLVATLLKKHEVTIDLRSLIENKGKLKEILKQLKLKKDEFNKKLPAEVLKLTELEKQKELEEAIKQQLNQCFSEFTGEWDGLKRLYSVYSLMGAEDVVKTEILEKFPCLDCSLNLNGYEESIETGQFKSLSQTIGRRGSLEKKLFSISVDNKKIKFGVTRVLETYPEELQDFFKSNDNLEEGDEEPEGREACSQSEILLELLLQNIMESGGAYKTLTPVSSQRNLSISEAENGGSGEAVVDEPSLAVDSRRSSMGALSGDVSTVNKSGYSDFSGDISAVSDGSDDDAEEVAGGGGAAVDDSQFVDKKSLEDLSIEHHEAVKKGFEVKTAELGAAKQRLYTEIQKRIQSLIEINQKNKTGLQNYQDECKKYKFTKTLRLIGLKEEKFEKIQDKLSGFDKELKKADSDFSVSLVFYEELTTWFSMHSIKPKEFKKIEKSLQSEKNKRIANINQFISEQREAFERQILEQNTVIKSAKNLTGLLSDLSGEDTYTQLSQLGQKQFKINRAERDGGEIHLSGIEGSDERPVESGFMTESDDGLAGGGGVKRDSLGIDDESADNGEFSTYNILLNFEQLKARYSTKLHENEALTKDMNKKYQELAVDLSKSYRQQKKAFVTKIQKNTEAINTKIDAYKSFLSELDSALYDTLNKLAVPDKLTLEDEKKEVINANEKNEIEQYIQDQQDVCTQLQGLLKQIEAKATQEQKSIVALNVGFVDFNDKIADLIAKREALIDAGIEVVLSPLFNIKIQEKKTVFEYQVPASAGDSAEATEIQRKIDLTLSAVWLNGAKIENVILEKFIGEELSLKVILENKNSILAKLDEFVLKRTDELKAAKIRAKTVLRKQIRSSESAFNTLIQQTTSQKGQLISFLSKIPALETFKNRLEQFQLPQAERKDADNKTLQDLMDLNNDLKSKITKLNRIQNDFITRLIDHSNTKREENEKIHDEIYSKYIEPLLRFNNIDKDKQEIYRLIASKFLQDSYPNLPEFSDEAIISVRQAVLTFLGSLAFVDFNFDLLSCLEIDAEESSEPETEISEDDCKKLYNEFDRFIQGFSGELNSDLIFKVLLNDVYNEADDIKDFYEKLKKSISVKGIQAQCRVLKVAYLDSSQVEGLGFEDILVKIAKTQVDIRRLSSFSVLPEDSSVLGLLGLELFAMTPKNPLSVWSELDKFLNLKAAEKNFSRIKALFMSLRVYENKFEFCSEFEKEWIVQIQRLLIFEGLNLASDDLAASEEGGGGGGAAAPKAADTLSKQAVLAELNALKSLESIDGLFVCKLQQEQISNYNKAQGVSKKSQFIETELFNFNLKYGNEFAVLPYDEISNNENKKLLPLQRAFQNAKLHVTEKIEELRKEFIEDINHICEFGLNELGGYDLKSNEIKQFLIHFLGLKLRRVLTHAAQKHSDVSTHVAQKPSDLESFRNKLVIRIIKILKFERSAFKRYEIVSADFDAYQAEVGMQDVFLMRFLCSTGLTKVRLEKGSKDDDFPQLLKKFKNQKDHKTPGKSKDESELGLNLVNGFLIGWIKQANRGNACPYNSYPKRNNSILKYEPGQREKEVEDAKNNELKDYNISKLSNTASTVTVDLGGIPFADTRLEKNETLALQKTVEAKMTALNECFLSILTILDSNSYQGDKPKLLEKLVHVILDSNEKSLKEIISILSKTLGGTDIVEEIFLHFIYPHSALNFQLINLHKDTSLSKFSYYQEFASPDIFRSFCQSVERSEFDFDFMRRVLQLMKMKCVVISKKQMIVMKQIKVAIERKTNKVVSLGAGEGKTFCVNFMAQLTKKVMLYAAPFKEADSSDAVETDSAKETALTNLVRVLKSFNGEDLQEKKLNFNAYALKYFLHYSQELINFLRKGDDQKRLGLTRRISRHFVNTPDAFIKLHFSDLTNLTNKKLFDEFTDCIQNLQLKDNSADDLKQFLSRLPVMLDEYDSERFSYTSPDTSAETTAYDDINFDVNDRLKKMQMSSVVKMSATDNDLVSRAKLLVYVSRFTRFVESTLEIFEDRKTRNNQIWQALLKKYVIQDGTLDTENLKADLKNSINKDDFSTHRLVSSYKAKLLPTKIDSYCEKIENEFNKILNNKRDKFLKERFSDNENAKFSCVSDANTWLTDSVFTIFDSYKKISDADVTVKANYLLLRPQADGDKHTIQQYLESINDRAEKQQQSCHVLVRNEYGQLMHYCIDKTGKVSSEKYKKEKSKFIAGLVICCYLEDSVGGDYDGYSRDNVKGVAVYYDKTFCNANNVYQHLKRNRGNDADTFFTVSLQTNKFKNYLQESNSGDYEENKFEDSKQWLEHSLAHAKVLVQKAQKHKSRSNEQFLFQLVEADALFVTDKINLYKKQVQVFAKESKKDCVLLLKKDDDMLLYLFIYSSGDVEEIEEGLFEEKCQEIKDSATSVVFCCYSQNSKASDFNQVYSSQFTNGRYDYYQDSLKDEISGALSNYYSGYELECHKRDYQAKFFESGQNLKSFFMKTINELNSHHFETGLQDVLKNSKASKFKKIYHKKTSYLLTELQTKQQYLENAIKQLQWHNEVNIPGTRKIPAYIFTAMLLRWLKVNDEKIYDLLTRSVKGHIEKKDSNKAGVINDLCDETYFEPDYELPENPEDSEKEDELISNRKHMSKRADGASRVASPVPIETKEESALAVYNPELFAFKQLINELAKVRPQLFESLNLSEASKQIIGRLKTDHNQSTESKSTHVPESRSRSISSVTDDDSESGTRSNTPYHTLRLSVEVKNTCREYATPKVVGKAAFTFLKQLIFQSEDKRPALLSNKDLEKKLERFLAKITERFINKSNFSYKEITEEIEHDFIKIIKYYIIKKRLFTAIERMLKYEYPDELSFSNSAFKDYYKFPKLDSNALDRSSETLATQELAETKYQNANLVTLSSIDVYQLLSYSSKSSSSADVRLPSPRRMTMARVFSPFNMGRGAAHGSRASSPASFGFTDGLESPVPNVTEEAMTHGGGGGSKALPETPRLPRIVNFLNLKQPANPSVGPSVSFISYRPGEPSPGSFNSGGGADAATGTSAFSRVGASSSSSSSSTNAPARTPAGSPRRGNNGNWVGGSASSFSPRRSGLGAAAALSSDSYTVYQVPNDENRSLLWAVVIGYMAPRLSDTKAYKKLFSLNHVVKEVIINKELASIKNFINSKALNDLIANTKLKDRVNNGFIDTLKSNLKEKDMTKFKEDLKNGTVDVKILETIASLLDVKIIVNGVSTELYNKVGKQGEIYISKGATGYSVLLQNEMEASSESTVDAKLLGGGSGLSPRNLQRQNGSGVGASKPNTPATPNGQKKNLSLKSSDLKPRTPGFATPKTAKNDNASVLVAGAPKTPLARAQNGDPAASASQFGVKPATTDSEFGLGFATATSLTPAQSTFRNPRACKTSGDGNCAFHAVFGRSISGVYTALNADEKRSELAERIRTAEAASELARLRNEGIKDLVMRGSNILGLQSLKTKCLDQTISSDEIINNWGVFEQILTQYPEIVRYINTHSRSRSKQFTLKQKFDAIINLDEPVLRALIVSITELNDAWETFCAASTASFDWESEITQEHVGAYAMYIKKSRQWLLPLELQMMAYAFNMKIHFYNTSASKKLINPEIYNREGDTEVHVCFNGINHYERVQLSELSESSQSSSPSKYTGLSVSLSGGGGGAGK